MINSLIGVESGGGGRREVVSTKHTAVPGRVNKRRGAPESCLWAGPALMCVWGVWGGVGCAPPNFFDC